MLEFITDNFKIDLTYLKPTYSIENGWFKNEIENDYSFPFDIPYEIFSNISTLDHYNTNEHVTEWIGKLNEDGVVKAARLTISEILGKKVSGILYIGFNDFTAFDKKLSELNLHKFPVDSLKNHAKECVVKGYPDVDYNFGMVHTNKYDPTSDEFYGFQKTINNFKAGEFIENDLEPDTNLDVIRNIMQPMPYLLYILKAGFAFDDKELAGDVLSIPEFKNAMLYANNDYFDAINRESLNFQIGHRQYVSIEDSLHLDRNNSIDIVKYTHEVLIERKGDYLLFGNIYSQFFFNYSRFSMSRLTPVNVSIKILRNNQIIDLLSGNLTPDVVGDNTGHKYFAFGFETSIDQEIQLEAGDRVLFEKTEAIRIPGFNETIDNYPYVADFRIIPVRYKYPNGDPMISIKDKNEIDLSLCVPDVTFKTLLENVMKLKKLDMYPKGKYVYMNYISKQINERDQALNLSDYNIEAPIMSPAEISAIELKFSDSNSDLYKYDAGYVDKNGVIYNDYKPIRTVNTVNIELLPYPDEVVNGVKSCIAFDDDKSKIRLVSFEPIPSLDSNLQPVTYQNKKFLIPYILENDYKEYINMCLFSNSFQWQNVVESNIMRDLDVNRLIYAYDNLHVLKSVEKQRINEYYWLVTFKSMNLKKQV